MNNSTATDAWVEALEDLLCEGRPVSPRGQLTFELPQHTMVLDMNHPVVTAGDRKISEKFLGAEAYWILTGSNKVSDIAPFNKNISKYSDDGEVFFGAYGPKIIDQIDFVIAKLIEDPDTRQAGLNIWRENPPPTKDVPCTVSMFFNIRQERLQTHVFMRSSDIWLGVPYDIFNFSMISMLVLCRLNFARAKAFAGSEQAQIVDPGTLYLTAASRHLYESNKPAALKVLSNYEGQSITQQVPRNLWISEQILMKTLDAIRNDEEASKWWLR
jgi:thymidylate synthase